MTSLFKTTRFFVLLLALGSCKKIDTLYCDESTPCINVEQPFCDLSGTRPASNGVAHTCIENPQNKGDAGVRPGVSAPDAQEQCTDSTICDDQTPICKNGICEICTPGKQGDTACESKSEATPICDTSGLCVECSNNAHCSGGQPICLVDTGICSPCSQDQQCESNVCNSSTGRCVLPSGIVYVDDAQGADNAQCGNSQGAAACKTIDGNQGALRKSTISRRYLHLATGIYIETIQITDQQLIIVGNQSHLMAPQSATTPPLRIKALSNVVLQNLYIEGGKGKSTGHGISCTNAEITLKNVTIRNNEKHGISSLDCTLSLESTNILENGQKGLDVKDGSVRIQRSNFSYNKAIGVHIKNSNIKLYQSKILGNALGGIKLVETSFTLENTIIANNGQKNATSVDDAGGILIENLLVANTEQEIQHCTIVNNSAPINVGSAGISCENSLVPVQLSNSIVYDNAALNRPQVSGNCEIMYSNIGGIGSGKGNISLPPKFINAATSDFHLKPESPGIDVADPNSPILFDIDGQPRPYGNGHDMGADEVQ